MQPLEDYYDIKLLEENEENSLKTYTASKNFIIKELKFNNIKDKQKILDFLEDIKEECCIYEIKIQNDSIFAILENTNNNFDKKYNEKIINEFQEECIIEGSGDYSKLDEIKNMYKFGAKVMCKIEAFVNGQKQNGTGFFMEIDKIYNLPFKRALFTCHHVLPEIFFEQNKILEIKYNNNIKKINIEDSQLFFRETDLQIFLANRGKRKIISNDEYDYTCIEILDTDNIFDNSSIKLFEPVYYYASKDIAILHYPKGEDLSFSLGQIKNNNNDLPYFLHTASTEGGSSGAPIIIRRQINNVVGIHFGGIKNGKANKAHTIMEILKDIRKNIYNRNTLRNNIATLNNHDNCVTNIFLINNEKLCSSSLDGTVIIYNLSSFEIEVKIEDISPILYCNLLSYNSIALCSNALIKIYKENNGFYKYFAKTKSEYELISTLYDHHNSVCQILEIDPETIVSLSLDRTMIVWKRKRYYLSEEFICSKILVVNENESSVTNALKINEKELVTCGFENNYIQFWDTKNFVNKKRIDNIKGNQNRNSMIMINHITLLVGGDDSDVYIIDTAIYELISHIIKYKRSVGSLTNLVNGNILMGCNDEDNQYSLFEYKYENNDLIEVNSQKNAHKGIITGLIGIDGEIISSSCDNTIKVWA